MKAFVAALVSFMAACAQPLGGTSSDPAATSERTPQLQRDTAVASAAGVEVHRASTPDERSHTAGRTITVGPDGEVRTIAEAAKIARSGDVVEVQPGEYRGDVAVWKQTRLTIRAVGGRPVLNAAGRSAEGKGIWVIRNGHFEVEGFDFVGARVPDRNGAGIRFEHGTLVVRDSRFLDNENGILTSNDGRSTLVIERSLFARNGHGDGYSHGVYAGRIARLEVRASYFHSGRAGHLLKSRAQDNRIEYNRLTDEDGDSSYELEFPNGGRALVVGNIVEQSAKTQNPVIVSYGAEGYRWPVNELVMSHNTVVDSGARNGVFVRVSPGNASAHLFDNLWVGAAKFSIAATVEESGNRQVPISALRDPARGDYRLSESALLAPKEDASDVPAAWLPRFQYRRDRAIEPLTQGAPLAGALQP